MENYPLKRTFNSKRLNRHLESTLTPAQLRAARVSKAKMESTLIMEADYLAFDSKYTFEVTILNESGQDGKCTHFKDHLEMPERNGECTTYIELDGKYIYLMKVPISEMESLRQLVADRLGILWNPKKVDLDWIEESEWMDYDEFCQGGQTAS